MSRSTVRRSRLIQTRFVCTAIPKARLSSLEKFDADSKAPVLAFDRSLRLDESRLVREPSPRDLRLWSVSSSVWRSDAAFDVSAALPHGVSGAHDNPDTHLFLWTLGWDVHAFTTQPLSIFDANIYYPQRLTLAYSENLIGSAFFAAPVLWLTGNSVTGTEHRHG